jgi:hypothetical protein
MAEFQWPILTRLYIEALLVDECLADQVWSLCDAAAFLDSVVPESGLKELLWGATTHTKRKEAFERPLYTRQPPVALAESERPVSDRKQSVE